MNLIYTKHEKGFSQVKKFKVVGVTFDNRQKTLEKLYRKQEKKKSIAVALDFTTFKGAPAIRILADNLDIGNIAKNDITKLYDNQDSILGIEKFKISLTEDYATTRDGEIKTDKDGNPIVTNKVFSALLSIVMANKSVKPIQPETKPIALNSQPDTNEPKKKRWQFWK